MNKNQALLAAACLVVALAGCQTDDGVQKGYLTPQQASSDASDQTESADSSTSERLTPPSVTQEAEQTASTETSTPQVESNGSAPTPTEPESTPTSTATESNQTASVSSSSTGSGSDRSPDAISRYSQPPGGKVGTNRPVVRSGASQDVQEREDSEPTREARREEPATESREEDEEGAPAASARTSAVSSNLSSGSTRIAEPTGSVRGVVVSVNGKAKFVVVKYNYRAIPSVGKVLSVVRNGVKVGQIKVTKPVKPPHSTADIIDGDIQRGDIVE
jgi:hypothetical protein